MFWDKLGIGGFELDIENGKWRYLSLNFDWWF